MDINDALYSHLSTYANLAALTGARIYPDNLPQNPVLPSITYLQLSETPIHEFKEDSKLARVTYQFTAWGTSRKSTQTVGKQIKKALQNFNGLMGGNSGVNVSGVLFLDASGDYESETNQYKKDLDFEIWFQEE